MRKSLWIILTVLVVASASPAKAGITITQSTCPIVIDQPGTYFLATDVGPCAPGVDGVDISASNVTWQLAGHTITSSSRKTARRRTIFGSIGSSRVYKYVHAGGVKTEILIHACIRQ
jgi:hypothetical protein